MEQKQKFSKIGVKDYIFNPNSVGRLGNMMINYFLFDGKDYIYIYIYLFFTLFKKRLNIDQIFKCIQYIVGYFYNKSIINRPKFIKLIIYLVNYLNNKFLYLQIYNQNFLYFLKFKKFYMSSVEKDLYVCKTQDCI